MQCKNTVDGLSLHVILREITDAEAFEPPLDRLYIATTAKRDAPLQKEVRVLSEARRRDRKFRVGVLFWDDVCQDLATDDNVFFTHHPHLRGKVDEARTHDRAMFDQLTYLLRLDGVVGFLDQNNMAGFSFPEARLEPLRVFYYEWDCPEREFISPELEAIRRALWEKADEYTRPQADQGVHYLQSHRQPAGGAAAPGPHQDREHGPLSRGGVEDALTLAEHTEV